MLAPPGGDVPIARGQTVVPSELDTRYAALDPVERVGQLFIVAFYVGPDTEPLADVRRLVTEQGIGGVVLQTGNRVIRNERGRDLARETAALTAEIQSVALGAEGPGVPLLVAVDHEGDGAPLTHLREGFTALPSAMAVGATWSAAGAHSIGQITGRELAAVGVNLLLGPSLDVLAEPATDSRGDIGTRAFGGDAFWVSQLGKAYVRGAHAGGDGRVATAAKHFPGHGNSDRLPDEEVATVAKPLDALAAVELPPFAAVTGAEGQARTDALMTSHISYRGLRGDVRQRTPPISFDREAMATILRLPGFPFGRWRADGGLVISDALGVPAVKRWFDPTEEQFNHRDIAQRALMAGNDGLVLAQFARSSQLADGGLGAAPWSRQLANIEDTIAYFARQYETDPGFRDRVDDAARRMLALKAELYQEWTPAVVAVDPERAASDVGGDAARNAVADLSRAAITELHLNSRPTGGERLLVVTDDRRTLVCRDESCGMEVERAARLQALGPTLVEALILERYGPSYGSGRVAPADVTSLRFCELARALRSEALIPEETAPAPPEAPAPDAGCPDAVSVAEARQRIRTADWVLFGFAALSPIEVRDLTGFLLPQTAALVQARGGKLGALSFGPPYYIDETNFFKLDAYYAAYSKIPSAVEAALAALFGDLEPQGASPVSIPGADYDLPSVLEPAARHPFPLTVVTPSQTSGLVAPTTVTVHAGPVRDHNGHRVPDGTPIELTVDPPGALTGGPLRTRTVDGEAQVSLTLARGGHLTIDAASGAADAAAAIVLDVASPRPTPRPTVDAPATATPSSTLADNGARPAGGRSDRLDWSDLLVGLAVVVLFGGGAAGHAGGRGLPPARQLRGALLVVVAGLTAYVGYGLALETAWRDRPSPLPLDGALALALGALAGLTLALLLAHRPDARPPSGPAAPGPTGPASTADEPSAQAPREEA